MMRVVLVTDNAPPQGNGHAVAVGWWADALARAGLEVTLVADAWRGRGAAALPPGVREHRLPILPLLAPGHPLAGLRPRPRALRELAREGADVLHQHGYGPTCRQVAAALRGVPRVMSVHAFPEGAGAGGVGLVHRVMGSLLAATARSADVATAPSAAAAARLAGSAGRPVDVLPTGVDDVFAAVSRRSRRPSAHERPRVLFVGRLTATKGLELVSELAAAHPEVDVALVGTGPPLPGVRRLGQLPPAGVAEEIAGADVVLAPSPFETQGLAVLEALTVGTPVVVPAGSAQAELVRAGIDGTLFRPFDAHDAWRAVVEAAGLPRELVAPPSSATRAALVSRLLVLYERALARPAERSARP
jgi:glycosyltransferase involved in cell wall biosynthesis